MKSASNHAATAGPTRHMHCAHMNKRDESGILLTAVVASPDCTHLLCTQPANATLPVQAFQSDQLKWAVVHPIPNLEVGIVPLRKIIETPPPDIVRSQASLTVALRI